MFDSHLSEITALSCLCPTPFSAHTVTCDLRPHIWHVVLMWKPSFGLELWLLWTEPVICGFASLLWGLSCLCSVFIISFLVTTHYTAFFLLFLLPLSKIQCLIAKLPSTNMCLSRWVQQACPPDTHCPAGWWPFMPLLSHLLRVCPQAKMWCPSIYFYHSQTSLMTCLLCEQQWWTLYVWWWSCCRSQF